MFKKEGENRHIAKKIFPHTTMENFACDDGKLRVQRWQTSRATISGNVRGSLDKGVPKCRPRGAEDYLRAAAAAKTAVSFCATTCGEAMLRTASENSGLGLMLIVDFIASAKAQASPTGT